jgi:hypothetical protein
MIRIYLAQVISITSFTDLINQAPTYPLENAICNTHYAIRISGGDERDRTAGLRRARAALSQLSYIPISLISR